MESIRREDQINYILSHIYNLSVSPLPSSGVVSMNLSEEQTKFFTFGRERDNLFGNQLYLKVLYALLRRYDESVKREEDVKLGVDGLFEYIDSHFSLTNAYGTDYEWLRSLLPENDKNNINALVDAYYIALMIQQSIMTNEERVYQFCVDRASNGANRNEISNAIFSQLAGSVNRGYR